MQSHLAPIALAEHSLEAHLARYAGRSRVLYLAVVAMLLAALGALPLIRVDVAVQSTGLIRPATEKHEVGAQAGGFVEAVAVRESEEVGPGKLLIALRPAPVDEQQKLVEAALLEQRLIVHDLERLTAGRSDPAGERVALRTARYRQQHAQLLSSMGESVARRDRAERDLARVRALYERHLAPTAELDDREFQVAQARSEGNLLVERARAGWQAELWAARTALRELETRVQQLRRDRLLYQVRSPVAGTVEELASLSPGSYVQPGQRLAIVSPRSPLVGEVYVSPRDVGLLAKGTPVRLLIDAFHHHHWGVVTGRVTEISDDFLLLDQKPFFRVRTSLDTEHLSLRTGVRGRLRKGMTLQARFVVAERTLWQLLRDDVSDWVSPVENEA